MGSKPNGHLLSTRVVSYQDSLIRVTAFGGVTAGIFISFFILLYWALDVSPIIILLNVIALLIDLTGLALVSHFHIHKPAAHLITLATYFSLFGTALFIGGIDSSSIVWMAFVPIAATNMAGTRDAIPWGVISLGSIVGVYTGYTLGVGVAGSGDASARRLAQVATAWGEGEESVVCGTGQRLPAPSAAIVNAFNIHCLEFDCVHEGAVVHPMATLLGAVIAHVARLGAVSGKDLLTAIALGVVAVAARVAVLASTGPYGQGESGRDRLEPGLEVRREARRPTANRFRRRVRDIARSRRAAESVHREEPVPRAGTAVRIRVGGPARERHDGAPVRAP